MIDNLYNGQDQRECLLTILRWAKLEGYDIPIDPAYAGIEDLEKEADYSLDYLNANVPDYIYDLEVSEYGWHFCRIALDRSVIECA